MKTHLTLIAIALAGATSLPAHAGCVGDDRGSPHVDGNGGTRWNTTFHSRWTSQEIIWRGGSEGHRSTCPPNASGPCTYNWGQTKSASWTKSQGFTLTASGEVGKANNHLWHGVAQATYSREWSKTETTSQTFDFGVTFPRGKTIEPAIVLTRRYVEGNMIGGWIHYKTETSNNMAGSMTRYCYRWDGARTYGKWSDKRAEGSPRRTYFIY